MLSQSSIEYLVTNGRKGYNWAFYTGCLHWKTGVCGGGGKGFYCWAKRNADRFHKGDFTPTLHLEKLIAPNFPERPSRIAVCFTGDLFGDWVKPYQRVISGGPILKDAIFDKIRYSPQHTFLFLTKAPKNLLLWSPFPKNCWVGVTATDGYSYDRAIQSLKEIRAAVKYVSFEPLLASPLIPPRWMAEERILNWVIIGAATAPLRLPEISWVEEIEQAADKSGIPVWEKNNLAKLLNRPLRQETP